MIRGGLFAKAECPLWKYEQAIARRNQRQWAIFVYFYSFSLFSLLFSVRLMRSMNLVTATAF